MANVSFADFVPNVVSQLKADPSTPLAIAAIQEKATELCVRTRCWQLAADPQDIEANVAEYDISPPSGATVASILGVSIGTIRLMPLTLSQASDVRPDWRSWTGTPRFFIQTDFSSVTLIPMPQASKKDALAMELALAPSASSSSAPEWLMTRYRKIIADGALAKLMLMPGKPFSDANEGLRRLSDYQTGVAAVMGEVSAGLSRAKHRVRACH
jgi:hypothetical protein